MGADGYQRLVRLIADKAKQMNIGDYEKVSNAIVSTMVGAVTVSRLTCDASTVDSVLTDAQNSIELLMRSAGSDLRAVGTNHYGCNDACRNSATREQTKQRWRTQATLGSRIGLTASGVQPTFERPDGGAGE